MKVLETLEFVQIKGLETKYSQSQKYYVMIIDYLP